MAPSSKLMSKKVQWRVQIRLELSGPISDINLHTGSRYLIRKVQVLRSRLIRTVVNLSLIVAMAIQPGISYGMTKDCETKRGSGFRCNGCSCCEVSSPSEKCSCCGGGESAVSETTCCMSRRDASDEAMHSDGILDLKVIVISTKSSAGCELNLDPADEDPEIAESAMELLLSTCRCGVESPPLGDSAPSRPTISPREPIAVRSFDLADIFGGRQPARPVRHDVSLSKASPHCSQILLCIWQL